MNKDDALEYVPESYFSVIPAKAGIQEFQQITFYLDTRFHGYDDLLQIHQR